MQELEQQPAQRRTVDVRTAAEIIGVSTTTIYAMVRQGQIPATKVRARILFHRDALEDWLKNGGTQV